MGHQSIVHGYIETTPGKDEENAQALERFAFDEGWPLKAIFPPPRPGYAGSFIAFADGIKARREDWPEWRARFEELLRSLRGISAQVDFAESDHPESESYAYVFVAGAGGRGHWKRWRRRPDGSDIEETDLPG